MFRGMFGRENTALKDGKYVKDLSYLNRPLKEVIYIDFTDEHMDYQQDNVLIVPKFEGDTEDRELVDLMPFLERKYNITTFSISYISNNFFFLCDRFCKISR